ncbi:MAG: hypothetical protein E6Q34_05565 [Burkholderiaceae bacterium]|nr:MAG: hypothetical protein E6Q34_05565 [Burkholderiaceae bacterium]
MSSFSAESVTVQVFPIVLSSAEREDLEAIACRERFGVNATSASAFTHSLGSKKVWAEVRCGTHGKIEGISIFGRAYCSKNAKAWNCDSSEVFMSLSAGARNYELAWSSVEPSSARAIFLGLLRQNASLGVAANDRDPMVCRMTRSETPDLLEISCGSWITTVSTWCPHSACPRIIFSRLGAIP